MDKTSARWVPRNINMLHRQQMVESSLDLLEVYNAKSENFHSRLVTGNETWLHHCDTNTEKSSCNGSALARPTPKTFRTKLSASVLGDSKEIY